MDRKNFGCPSCGIETPSSSSFCSGCGAKLATDQTDGRKSLEVPSLKPSPGPNTQGVSPSHKVGIQAIVYVVLVLAVFLIFAYPVISGGCRIATAMSRDPVEMKSKIRLGMTKQEVREALGEPMNVSSQSSQPFGEVERWSYGRLSVSFSSGSVTSVVQL